MTDDIVAELERWLITSWAMVQHARDEIVTLRQALHAEMMGRPDKWHAFIAEARDTALDEAAKLCELSAEIMQPDEQRLSDAIAAVKNCAAAIRALKDNRP